MRGCIVAIIMDGPRIPGASNPSAAPDPPAHAPDGVDLTLIRWTLSMTPLERLELLQNWVDGLAELKNGRVSEP
jgi:hypothetical protein